MRDHDAYDYAIIRVVPRVEREEFVNAGVVVSCPRRRFLEARVELDAARIVALAPDVDLELVRRHLDTIPVICRGGDAAGPIGRLPPRERFHWLTATRSAVIQLSPVHTGRCVEPGELLERLMDTMVRVHRVAGAAQGPDHAADAGNAGATGNVRPR